LIKISWDTNDFIYQYKSTRLRVFGVFCKGCSIGAWHVESRSIVFINPVTGELVTYGRNTLEILEGGMLTFDAVFVDTLRTGIDRPELSLSNFIRVNNPFKEELNLTFTQPSTGQLQLHNTLGQVVYAQQIPSTQTTSLPINTQHLDPGVYYLTYTLGQTNQTLLQKLVKY
ncbi:MAG: T9SS type A sorting domain-containing protein, partial [Bacteroidia bacterium]|nr:T9SS type A sorting domain-containing protein [Bacteroidia bacterium]